MECQIDAPTAPESVQWLFNGQELVQSDRVEMSFVQDLGLAHLTIHQVGPVDSGQYTCMVTGQVMEPSTKQPMPKTITSTSQVTISGKHKQHGRKHIYTHPHSHTEAHAPPRLASHHINSPSFRKRIIHLYGLALLAPRRISPSESDLERTAFLSVLVWLSATAL